MKRLIMVGLGTLLGTPIGILAGVYLAEYGRNRYGDIVRFISDVLNGVPSIVIGIVAYQWVVKPFSHFSMISGCVALGIMMLPVVVRATEETMILVSYELVNVLVVSASLRSYSCCMAVVVLAA